MNIILVYAFLGGFLLPIAGKADGPNEEIRRYSFALTNAGIATNSASLIQALKHTNDSIAIGAAFLLKKLPESPERIAALTDTAQSGKEYIALAALTSLSNFKDNGWIVVATNRLMDMKDTNARIDLATLLAKAGNTEGWKVYVHTLSDPIFARRALEQIELFDKMRTPKGKIIDVLDELKTLAETVPEANRQAIRDKIEKLNMRTKTK